MQTKQKTTGLVWFGNDLRIQDNDVLNEAIQQNDQVIGVYCLNPALFEKTNFGFRKLGVYRAKFLLETLRDLKENLAKQNISLLVYEQPSKEIIPEICKRFQVDTIYKQKEWTSEEKSHRVA